MSLSKQIGKNLKQELKETKAICGELLRVVYFAGQAIEDIEKGTARPEEVQEVKDVINQLLNDFGVVSVKANDEQETDKD